MNGEMLCVSAVAATALVKLDVWASFLACLACAVLIAVTVLAAQRAPEPNDSQKNLPVSR